jgi:putative transposase
VAASTAVDWLKRVADTGSVAPGKLGGHKPKKIAGTHRDWLIERCRGGSFTLRGLVRELAERGLKVDYHSVWDFVHAEGLTHKKRRSSQPSRIAPTSRAADRNGSPARP